MDGTRTASTQVDGTSDRLMALVDSLSLILVGEVWQSSGTVPLFDLSAMTSRNPDALGAFLEGERHYRQSRWEDAIQAFETALSHDSTFALAYYRISNAMGWGNYPFAESQAMAARAAALGDRLPPRERTLVSARSAPDRSTSIEILRPFVERHPEDFEGVYWLADDLFHSLDENVVLGGRPVAAQLRLFDQATKLDPQFTASFIHPPGFEREAWTRLGLAGLVRFDEVPHDTRLRSGTEAQIEFLDAFDRGDSEAARQAALSIAERSEQRGATDTTWMRIAESTQGLTDWMDARDPSALGRVEAAIRSADGSDDWVPAYAFRWAMAAAETPELQTRALTELSREGRWASEYEPVRLAALARVLSRRGDSEGQRLTNQLMESSRSGGW